MFENHVIEPKFVVLRELLKKEAQEISSIPSKRSLRTSSLAPGFVPNKGRQPATGAGQVSGYRVGGGGAPGGAGGGSCGSWQRGNPWDISCPFKKDRYLFKRTHGISRLGGRGCDRSTRNKHSSAKRYVRGKSTVST